MKDKEWLKDSLAKEMYNAEIQGMFSSSGMPNLLYDDIVKLIGQLDEPEITKEHAKPVIPTWVADIIENNRISQRESPSDLWRFIRRDKRFSKWLSCDLPDVSYREMEEIVLTAILFGYTIEPPKTLQVIVKNYDSTVYKTELPEDEAMKLIEGWKGNE